MFRYFVLLDMFWNFDLLIIVLLQQPARCSIKKKLLKISQNSQEKTCAIVSFLIKLQASVLQLYLKRNSGTGFFLWILRNLWEHFFNNAPPGHCIYSSYPFNIVRGMLICFRWKTMFLFIIWVRTTSNCMYTRSFKQELFAVSVG